jgi:hypothetical protein
MLKRHEGRSSLWKVMDAAAAAERRLRVNSARMVQEMAQLRMCIADLITCAVAKESLSSGTNRLFETAVPSLSSLQQQTLWNAHDLDPLCAGHFV